MTRGCPKAGINNRYRRDRYGAQQPPSSHLLRPNAATRHNTSARKKHFVPGRRWKSLLRHVGPNALTAITKIPAEQYTVLQNRRATQTYLIRVDDAVEVRVGHAVTGQLEVGLYVGLLGVGAVDRVQLVESRLKKKKKAREGTTQLSSCFQITKKKRYKLKKRRCQMLTSSRFRPIDEHHPRITSPTSTSQTLASKFREENKTSCLSENEGPRHVMISSSSSSPKTTTPRFDRIAPVPSVGTLRRSC